MTSLEQWHYGASATVNTAVGSIPEVWYYEDTLYCY